MNTISSQVNRAGKILVREQTHPAIQRGELKTYSLPLHSYLFCIKAATVL